MLFAFQHLHQSIRVKWVMKHWTQLLELLTSTNLASSINVKTRRVRSLVRHSWRREVQCLSFGHCIIATNMHAKRRINTRIIVHIYVLFGYCPPFPILFLQPATYQNSLIPLSISNQFLTSSLDSYYFLFSPRKREVTTLQPNYYVWPYTCTLSVALLLTHWTTSTSTIAEGWRAGEKKNWWSKACEHKFLFARSHRTAAWSIIGPIQQKEDRKRWERLAPAACQEYCANAQLEQKYSLRNTFWTWHVAHNGC